MVSLSVFTLGSSPGKEDGLVFLGKLNNFTTFS